jgi:hypothetical protein
MHNPQVVPDCSSGFKKSIEFIIEFCPASPCFPTEDCDFMETHRVRYRVWFEDPRLFGDGGSQNKDF